jgi:hypothetical protein
VAQDGFSIEQHVAIALAIREAPSFRRIRGTQSSSKREKSCGAEK